MSAPAPLERRCQRLVQRVDWNLRGGAAAAAAAAASHFQGHQGQGRCLVSRHCAHSTRCSPAAGVAGGLRLHGRHSCAADYLHDRGRQHSVPESAGRAPPSDGREAQVPSGRSYHRGRHRGSTGSATCDSAAAAVAAAVADDEDAGHAVGAAATNAPDGFPHSRLQLHRRRQKKEAQGARCQRWRHLRPLAEVVAGGCRLGR